MQSSNHLLNYFQPDIFKPLESKRSYNTSIETKEVPLEAFYENLYPLEKTTILSFPIIKEEKETKSELQTIYEKQFIELTDALTLHAEELKIPESQHINIFQNYFFEKTYQKDQSEEYYYQVKLNLEKILYILLHDHKITPQTKKYFFQKFCEQINVCTMGAFAYIELSLNNLSSDPSCENILAEMRKNIIDHFAAMHITAKEGEILEGNEVHVYTKLYKIAEQIDFSPSISVKNIKDIYETKSVTLLSHFDIDSFVRHCRNAFTPKAVLDCIEYNFFLEYKKRIEKYEIKEEKDHWIDANIKVNPYFQKFRESIEYLIKAIGCGEAGMPLLEYDDTTYCLRINPETFKAKYLKYCKENSLLFKAHCWVKKELNNGLTLHINQFDTHLLWIEDSSQEVVNWRELQTNPSLFPLLPEKILTIFLGEEKHKPFEKFLPFENYLTLVKDKSLEIVASSVQDYLKKIFPTISKLKFFILNNVNIPILPLINGIGIPRLQHLFSELISFIIFYQFTGEINFHRKKEFLDIILNRITHFFMHELAIKNETGALSEILQTCLSPNTLNRQGRTPIHLAAQHGSIDSFKLLARHQNCILLKTDWTIGLRPDFEIRIRGALTELINNGATLGRYAAQKSKTTILTFIDRYNLSRCIKNVTDFLDFLNAFPADPTQDELEKIEIVSSCINAKQFFAKLAENNTAGLARFITAGIIPAAEEKELLAAVSARVGNKDTLQLLAREGTNLDSREVPSGITPLYLAVENGHFEAVKFLVEEKANVNIITNKLMTPFLIAVYKGYANIEQYLLVNGVDLHFDGFNDIAVTNAVVNDDIEFLRLLIRAKATTHINDQKNSLLSLSSYYNQSGHILTFLKENGFEVRQQNTIGITELVSAISRTNPNKIKFLVEMKADINIKYSSDEITLLHGAVQCYEGPLIEYLIEQKADVNAVSKQNETALLIAAQNHNQEAVDILLAHRANPKVAATSNSLMQLAKNAKIRELLSATSLEEKSATLLSNDSSLPLAAQPKNFALTQEVFAPAESKAIVLGRINNMPFWLAQLRTKIILLNAKYYQEKYEPELFLKLAVIKGWQPLYLTTHDISITLPPEICDEFVIKFHNAYNFQSIIHNLIIDTTKDLLFTNLEWEKLILKYFHDNQYLVTQGSWVKEPIFKDFTLIRLQDPSYAEYFYIESNKTRDIVKFIDLPEQEQQRYFTYSYSIYSVPNRYNATHSQLSMRHYLPTDAALIEHVELMKKHNRLNINAAFFTSYLRDHPLHPNPRSNPEALIDALVSLPKKNLLELLDAMEMDYIILNSRDPLHKAFKLLPDIAMQKNQLELAQLLSHRIQNIIQHQMKFIHLFEEKNVEVKNTPRDILYSELLKAAEKITPEMQFIYHAFLRRYFPVAEAYCFDKNYAAAFIEAHNTSMMRFDEPPEIFTVIKDGDLSALSKMSLHDHSFFEESDSNHVSLGKWAAICQHQPILDYIYDVIKSKPGYEQDFVYPKLFWAIKYKQYQDIYRLALDDSDSIQFPLHSSDLALNLAVETGDIEIVKFLLWKMLPIRTSICPLDIAVQENHYDIAALLLYSYVSVKDEQLLKATMNGQKNLLNLLIAHGADLNSKKFTEDTPLTLAVINNHEDLVGYLLAEGANPNRATANGSSPLLGAIQQKNLNIVKILLDNGANPNLIVEGRAALFSAIETNQLSLIKLLIKYGANVNIDFDGKIPLNIAIAQKDHLLVELLILHGAKPNSKSFSYEEGDTVLQKLVLSAELKLFIEQKNVAEESKVSSLFASFPMSEKKLVANELYLAMNSTTPRENILALESRHSKIILQAPLDDFMKKINFVFPPFSQVRKLKL